MIQTEYSDEPTARRQENDNLINFAQEIDFLEKLSMLVYEYPVLYDNSHNEYNRKEVKKEAWKEIALKLGLNDEYVEKEWEKLRSRYNRVKRELREKTIAGANAGILKSAKRRMDELKFISWLDIFIRQRQSRGSYDVFSNKKLRKQDQDEVKEESLEENSSVILYNDDGNSFTDSINEPMFNLSTMQTTASSRKRKYENDDVGKYKLNRYTEKQAEKELSICQEVAATCKVTENVRDEHDIFGELLATKLRKLSDIISGGELDNVQTSLLTLLKNARATSKIHATKIHSYSSYK